MFLQWLFKPDTLIYLAFCNEYIQWEIFLYMHGGLLCSISSLNCKKLGDSMIRVKKLWLEGHIWSVDKESTCQWRRSRRCRFDPWVEKIPWRRKWQPTPVFLPGKSQGQRSLAGYGSWDHKESDMTGCAHTHTQSIVLNLELPKYNRTFCLQKQFPKWPQDGNHTTRTSLEMPLFFSESVCVCVFIRERKGERRKRGKEKESHLLGLVFMLSLCFSSLPLFSLPLFLISFHS